MKAVREPASLPLFHDELWLARLRRIVPAWGRRFPSGHVFARPGQALGAVHVVASGAVSLASSSKAGKKAILALVGPGGVFGQEAIVPPGAVPTAVPSCSAVVGWELTQVQVRAITPCTTLVFAIPQLCEALRRDPFIGSWLAASLAARKLALERALARALSLPVKERVLDVLRELAGAHGRPTPAGIVLEIPLSQDDIGALVGATRESVNRALRQLSQSGSLYRENGTYIVRGP
jgi:CRP/FNR family cyclic AMP-dependent transcriptional regulator